MVPWWIRPAELWDRFLGRTCEFLGVEAEAPAPEVKTPTYTSIRREVWRVRHESDTDTFLVQMCGSTLIRILDRQEFQNEFAVEPPYDGAEFLVESIRTNVVVTSRDISGSGREWVKIQ